MSKKDKGKGDSIGIVIESSALGLLVVAVLLICSTLFDGLALAIGYLLGVLTWIIILFPFMIERIIELEEKKIKKEV